MASSQDPGPGKNVFFDPRLFVVACLKIILFVRGA